jgi:histidinol-phosphate aminotransferase
MPLSRRTFVRTLSLGGAGALGASLVAARGHEALAWALDGGAGQGLRPPPDGALRLDSNENPHGPSAAALDAVRGAFGEAARYPGDATAALAEAVAAAHGVKRENVLLGVGSTEVLRMAVLAFTARDRALVTAAPTFETPTRVAEAAGVPVRAVRVDGALRLDLGAMADRAPGAGLVFVCNPNNPTGTVHPAAAVRDLVDRVRRGSPETVVLVDEAYHEFVDDPGYATAVPLALADPRVVVARTFSKAFGLAGLRVGYAIGLPPALDAMRRHQLTLGVGVLGAAAALATLGERDFVARQRALNREARELTRRFLADGGWAVAPSHANFLLVDVRRDARAFQQACATRGVLVGRPFPPLATHARISIGTLDEMRRALPVFRDVLAT